MGELAMGLILHILLLCLLWLLRIHTGSHLSLLSLPHLPRSTHIPLQGHLSLKFSLQLLFLSLRHLFLHLPTEGKPEILLLLTGRRISTR
jgi:hypothetical protein